VQVPIDYRLAEPSAVFIAIERHRVRFIGISLFGFYGFPEAVLSGPTIALCSFIRNSLGQVFPKLGWTSRNARQIWPHPGTGVNRVGG
jgi:hypothetical protein